MKKIIFVSDSLRIGGIQRSLVNLINEIDFNKYYVDLFLFNNEGEYLKLINENVNIISGNYFLKLAGSTNESIKKKSIVKYFLRKILSILCLIFGSETVFKVLFYFESKIEGYDFAISYSNNINNKSLYFGYNKFVLEKVTAKKKFAWIHVDCEKIEIDNNYNKNEYEKFDKIIAVSKATQRSFNTKFNNCKEKSEFIYNILPSKTLYINAKKYNPYNDVNSFKIVTVSRLDENKAVDLLVKQGMILRDKNINYKWYILGDGPQYEYIKKYIKENKLDENIKLIGYIDNPYPYIYYSDLLVSASKSESFGLNIAEALILGVPIIARDYPSLSEIVRDRENGVIIKNENDFHKVIEYLINNPDVYIKLKGNANLDCINNKETMKKLYGIFNG